MFRMNPPILRLRSTKIRLSTAPSRWACPAAGNRKGLSLLDLTLIMSWGRKCSMKCMITSAARGVSSMLSSLLFLTCHQFELNMARLPLAHWQLEVATGSIDLQGSDVRAPSGTAAHGNVMENANDGVVDFLRCRGRLTAGNGLHALPQAVRQFKPSHQLAGVTELGQPLGVSGSDLDIMVDPLDLAVVTAFYLSQSRVHPISECDQPVDFRSPGLDDVCQCDETRCGI